jgi:hypothetical protein
MKMFRSLQTAFVVAVLSFALQCPAQIITLQDGNSIARIDPSTQAGMFDWLIQTTPTAAVDQLTKQWFWYRIGNTAESSIDTIGAPQIIQTSPFSATTTYFDPLQRFSISVRYTLQGGQFLSGTADISEQIAINNLSSAPLDFHFFQYSDFDLAGTPGNDSVFLGGSTFSGKVNQADQVDGTSLVEVVNTPGATHGETAMVFTTLNSLNDGVPTTLSDNWQTLNGDVTWALQWDQIIPVEGTLSISKDKRVDLTFVPEPGSLALLSLGLVAFALRRRQ